MKKFKGTILALFTVSSLIFLAACGGGNKETAGESKGEGSGKSSSGQETITLKLGHQSPEETPYQYLAVEFKELVEVRTNGKVTIEIFPFRQMGTDIELMEQMQVGSLDFAVITGSAVSNFAPEMMVLDLPYLFDSREHVYKFLDSDSGKELLKETEKVGMITFGAMPREFRHITNSKKPIETPEDLKGLKLRVSESQMYLDAYKLLGANVVTMNWGDTYSGLQLGSIDGQENSLDVINDEKVNEVQKYVSKTAINFAFANLMGSKSNFEELPADIQEIIIRAADEAVKETRKVYETYDKEYTKVLTEKGMEINEVDTAPFKKLVQPVYDQYKNEDFYKYAEAIKELE